MSDDGSAILFSTYLGGTTGITRFLDLDLDSSDNPIVVGSTTSNFYPVTPGVFQPVFTGTECSVITKLNATGTGLIYSTFVGGSQNSRGSGLDVDELGQAYVSGSVDSTDFPTTPGAFQVVAPPGLNAFLYKMNASGTALIYSTYIGGSATEESTDVAIDEFGNAFLCGSTTSADFPVTPGAFQTALQGTTSGYITKVNNSGTGLIFSTYLGGAAGNTHVLDLNIRENVILVTGDTDSASFPVTPDAFQPALRGSLSAFAVIMVPTGTALGYSTYLGGSGTQTGYAVEFQPDSPEAVTFIAGITTSPDFPVTPGAFDTTALSNPRLFLMQFTPSTNLTVSKTPDQTQVLRGSTVTYAIQLVNTSEIGGGTDPTLTNVTVTDPMLGLSVNIGTLLGGQTYGLTVPFTVPPTTPLGTLSNTVSVICDQFAFPRFGTAVIQIVSDQAVSFTKTVTPRFAQPGSTVSFAIIVDNTGTADLTNAVLTDVLLGINESLDTIPPGSAYTLTVPFVIPGNAVIGSVISNTAELTADHLTLQQASASVEVIDIAQLALTKTPDRLFVSPGDTVTFTVGVFNSGRVNVTNILLTDDITGFQATIPFLPIGDRRIFTVPLLVPLETPPQLYTNTARAVSDQTAAVTASASVTVNAVPRVGLRKLPSQTSVTPGQTIEYTVTVSNFGNIPLTSVVINDPLLGIHLAVPDIAVGSLAVRNLPFTIPLNARIGSEIVNELTVSTAETGPQSVQSTVTVASTGISIAKQSSTAIAAPGTTVVYTLTAGNLLPVVQTNIRLDDAMLGIHEVVPLLEVNETLVRTGSFTVPPNAVNGSVITNVFIVSSDQTFAQAAEFGITVQSGPPGPPTTLAASKLADRNIAAPGEEVNYTVEVSNVGPNPATVIIVSDSLTGTNNIVPVLAPGETARLFYSFILPEQALQGTVFANRVTVASPEAPTVQSEFRVTTGLPRTLLSLANTASRPVANPGETVLFTVIVQNVSSSFTLTNVRVIEPLTNFSTQIPQLGSGELQSFTQPFVIPADAIGGTVITSQAFAASDQTPLQDAPAIVTVASLPNVELTHQVSPRSGHSGQTVIFSIRIRNTGNVDLINVLITAPLLDVRLLSERIPIGSDQTLQIPFILPEVDEDTTLVSTVTLTSDNGPVRTASASVLVIHEEE
ncbi:DUF7507 domain-containing protein [Paenibacillus protaetiae]|uniref:DUF11 domain-containing protein n=1 Tax=Paenibacillus protaetiae TaxID=2509456 RepID=A0A4P6EUT3_9BACL|nr:SBBP repeat-containing protein [Paenibacillus protaetiae]QAY65893.1 DUF11 domain-containing protein [Paenibacillus protaetiae]